MAKKNEIIEYFVHDLLGHVSGVTSRAMFGGYGLYRDGFIFAITVEDELYFKTDAESEAKFEKYGSEPFVYSQGKHKPTKMPYWKLPEEVMEDKELLADWVEASAEITKKSKKGKKK